MADELRSSEVKLRVLGLAEMNNRVYADVFADKLKALVRALEAADKSANGKLMHHYVISDLRPSSASATIEEKANLIPSNGLTSASSATVFGYCVRAVNEGRDSEARRYRECVRVLDRLATGVGHSFSRAELSVGHDQPVVIDDYFLASARRISRPKDLDKNKVPLFKGTAIGSFDGRILEVDFRGAIPTGILRLTAGGKDVKCQFYELEHDSIKEMIEQRVRLTALAHYDGLTGLPVRLTVKALPQTIKTNPNFLAWKDRFNELEADDWESS